MITFPCLCDFCLSVCPWRESLQQDITCSPGWGAHANLKPIRLLIYSALVMCFGPTKIPRGVGLFTVPADSSQPPPSALALISWLLVPLHHHVCLGSAELRFSVASGKYRNNLSICELQGSEDVLILKLI